MKHQFGYHLHPWPSETRRGAGPIRSSTSALQIFRPVLLPPLLPQEPQKYDPQDARLQPLVPGTVAPSGSSRLPDCPLFRPRSTRCLQLCHPKRCAPNRGEPLLQAANAQNSDALTVQSNPTTSVALQQDYAQSGREPLQKLVPRLMRAYHSAPSLMRSLPPWSLGKRRSLLNATRIGPHRTEIKQRARRSLRPETVHLQSARSY